MSIFIKIFLTILVSITFSFVFFTNSIISIEKNLSEEKLDKKIEYNKISYSNIISLLLFELNKNVLITQLNSIYLDDEIIQIELIDYTNIINYELKSKKFDSTKVIKSKINLVYQEEVLGELNLYYTKEVINKHIQTYKMNIIKFSILLGVILLLTILYFIKTFTNSIQKLSQATSAIASGNLLTKIDVKTNDEIGLLARKFENMRVSLKDRVDTIEKQKKQIQSFNQDLQQSVYERTEELEESNEELQTMIYNLKETQDKLVDSEKMASLGSLVAGVAHEINTPIGIGITGITHFLENTEIVKGKYENEDISEEEFKEYLETSNELALLIYSNLEKTAHFVRSFKQISVDQMSEDKREFNLKEYTKEVLFSISNITKKTNINIKVLCEDDLTINTYAGSFSQIITNLVINSIRHGFDEKEKGEIVIDISFHDDSYELIYKDNGKGIKKENISKIFDPLFTTNREKGGTGLGLNIIYNIVTTILKGTISCESEEHKGVEFRIVF